MKRHDINPLENEHDGLDDRYLKGEPDYVGIFLVMVAIIVLVICFFSKIRK